MKAISAIAPWYGANRMNADRPGKLLRGCKWVGVPFAGGMSELKYIDARTVLVNDLHRHVINLAQCIGCPEGHLRLMDYLDGKLFHPDELKAAQRRCLEREAREVPFVPDRGDVPWAIDYFVCAWMGRNGLAGTDGEFKAGLSFRWEAGGGDSARRFRSATEAIEDFHPIMRRCTFTTMDAFEFLENVHDAEGHGIYVDAPWPDDGDGYTHKFDGTHQRRLAQTLGWFKKTRVVVRFGDHPLIRELYPEGFWQWIRFDGRTSANKAKAEVLIVNGRVNLDMTGH